MWFGVAPPSPSRVDRKERHPPLCSCSLHRIEREKRLEAERQQALLSPRKPAPPSQSLKPSQASSALGVPLSSRQQRATFITKITVSPRTHEASPLRPPTQLVHGGTSHAKQLSQKRQGGSDSADIQHESWPKLAPAVDTCKSQRSQPELTEEEVPDLHGSSEVLLDFMADCGESWPNLSKVTSIRDSGATAMPTSGPPAGVLPSGVLESQEDLRYVPQTVFISTPCILYSISAVYDRFTIYRTALPLVLQVSKSRCSSRQYSTRSTLPEVDNHEESNNIDSGWSPTLPSLVSLRPEHLVGHTSSICALVVHGDRFVVSCSIDGSVKVWSQITFSCLHSLYGHHDVVSCVDLNARWLVSGSHDGTLRLYDCASGGFELLHVLTGHLGHVTHVQLPPSLPSYVLSCSDDSTLRLWNGELGQCVLELLAHKSRVTCFAVQLASIFSGAADAAICIWDISSLDSNHDQPLNQQISCAKMFHIHRATVQCIVNVTSAKKIATLAHRASETCSLVASGSNDGTIQLFNASTFEHLGRLDNTGSPVYKMVPLVNGRLLCSTKDGRLLIYGNLSRPLFRKPAAVLQLASKWISTLQVCGDVVACSCEEVLFIVDTVRMCVILVFETQHSFITCARWIHKRALITAGQDNVIKLWTIA
ncbi:hypothetical protein BBJ28_00004943 [Nothophytophthora sp. Chile5]|nr:hypothetical protein BBJ28_00004943 [Nothophytophthora sp. Chile5]